MIYTLMLFPSLKNRANHFPLHYMLPCPSLIAFINNVSSGFKSRICTWIAFIQQFLCSWAKPTSLLFHTRLMMKFPYSRIEVLSSNAYWAILKNLEFKCKCIDKSHRLEFWETKGGWESCVWWCRRVGKQRYTRVSGKNEICKAKSHLSSFSNSNQTQP